MEFRVNSFYGLKIVKGRFLKFNGRLDFATRPRVSLTIEASSLSSGLKLRDKGLLSEKIFHAEKHPELQFVAETATLDGGRLQLRGRLSAAGMDTPVDVDSTVTAVGDEFEIDGSAEVDQRKLGITHSPFGAVRTPTKLLLRGRLIRAA